MITEKIKMFKLFNLIIINLFILYQVKSEFNLFKNRNGLIFYNLKNNHTLLPPIVTSDKYGPALRLPIIGMPCSCQNLLCGCCAGMNMQQFNNQCNMTTFF